MRESLSPPCVGSGWVLECCATIQEQKCASTLFVYLQRAWRDVKRGERDRGPDLINLAVGSEVQLFVEQLSIDPF